MLAVNDNGPAPISMGSFPGLCVQNAKPSPLTVFVFLVLLFGVKETHSL